MYWQFPPEYLQRNAFLFEQTSYSYSQLQQLIDETLGKLPAQGELAFLLCSNTLNTMVNYLACLQKKVPVMLLQRDIDKPRLEHLINEYKPRMIMQEADYHSTDFLQGQIDPRAAILLSTSGSTGAAKQVVLSYDNLQANAVAISEYLPIQDSDITITTLPCHYSYGLSVINTHLLKGACCVLNDDSVVSANFWKLFKEHKISSLAGVPYTYEMLAKLRFHQKEHPNLKYLTQAGGRMKQEMLGLFADWSIKHDTPFYVMYGQTEATARMAWLAPELLTQKMGAIGRAIPGGQFTLINDSGVPVVEGEGELVYEGPNVMLGYASGRAELTSFAAQQKLNTGDLARKDADGDYFITGRIKRFVKVFGLRISLDEVEKVLEANGISAKLTGKDDLLYVAIISGDAGEIRNTLSKSLKLHVGTIKVMKLDCFPVNANQKTDYPALKRLFEESQGNV